MPNYKEMYHQLFRAQTEAIEILQKAQQKSEQIYIDSPEPDIVVLNKKVSETTDKPQNHGSGHSSRNEIRRPPLT